MMKQCPLYFGKVCLFFQATLDANLNAYSLSSRLMI